MKKDIHPINHPAIFIDSGAGKQFKTISTKKGEETKEIDGVTYQIHHIEISSASHPFYTGKQVLLDTARRGEKFQERFAKQTAAAAVRKGKKAKREKAVAKKVEAEKEKKSKKENGSSAEAK
jgi:large subunit ribosomal protein L31